MAKEENRYSVHFFGNHLTVTNSHGDTGTASYRHVMHDDIVLSSAEDLSEEQVTKLVKIAQRNLFEQIFKTIKFKQLVAHANKIANQE